MNFSWKSVLPRWSMNHPWITLISILVITLLALAVFPWIQINTDPEDMLPETHPARLTNDEIKDSFYLYDMVAVAIEPAEGNQQLTPDQLRILSELVETIRRVEGVVEQDIFSVYTTDDIEGVPGGIHVDEMLRTPPEDVEGVNNLVDRVEDHPVLKGMSLNPGNGALALFIPVEEKHFSYPVRQAVESFWENQGGNGSIHVTGLPVAEESFGVEMFYQMGTAAPLAFLIIGLIMLWFFRSLSLVAWSLGLSMVTVIWTMGALIALGFEVHIMSSMIPIFVLPIAVVDSIHLLSDFTDRYDPQTDSLFDEMADVYEHLFMPILFTSITSAVGFYSLLFTGIPPVRVFGAAVGTGILLAFLMTLTVLPAGIALWTPQPSTAGKKSWIGNLARWNGRFLQSWSRPVLIVGIILCLTGLYGLTFIQVNDNPTRWFLSDHPIRQADEYFNRSFAGSYPAYLVLEGEEGDWYQPEHLYALETMLTELNQEPNVGKTMALPDLVDKIHRELYNGNPPIERPEQARAVRQYLFLYENSGNPEDLFRLVDQDGSAVNVWFHLNSGDNQDMAAVRDRTESLLEAHGLSQTFDVRWAGITYVNLVWQGVMVNGMAWALISAFGVIFLMLILLFRNLRWALLAILPLTITMIVIYGGIGWIGKDYDMPVAVLSSLSIGIAIDFAIHYVQRTRQFLRKNDGGWPAIRELVSGEPARAIARNAVVISVGFLPLFFSPLRPYVTVGIFMFLIMATSGFATLVGLTTLLETFHRWIPTDLEEEGWL